jgi:peptidoglycan/xylan/chitin deacetylase (PgdA/CDA1 family)/DNA-binding beta-propeller fold protein YncE
VILGAVRCTALALALSQGDVLPATAQTQSAKRVAITIDDLPVVSRNFQTAADHDRITRQLVRALGAHRVPAIGFVNEGKMHRASQVDSAEVALLRQWTRAGLELGNHTYAHLDLHTAPIADYLDGIVRGDVITRNVLGEAGNQPRYFRHPFLHTGRSLGDRARVDSVLSARGYRVAPVTMDNSDYVFAAAYDDALGRRDSVQAGKIGTAYIDYMDRVFAYYEAQTRTIVGRDIPHVLLIHASLLNADWFDRLATMIERRGYAFVSLEEALKDSAYQSADTYVGPAGMTWLHRWALTRGLRGAIFAGEPEVPAWVTNNGTQRRQRPPPPAAVPGIDKPLASRADRAVRIAGEPDWLATFNHDLWTTAPATPPAGAVLRINGQSGTVVARIPVDSTCGPIVAALGAIWVHTCGTRRAIVRIDPDANRVTHRLPLGMANSEGAFAFAGGSIWLTSDTTSTLTRAHPLYGQGSATTPVAPHSYTVVAGGGALWVVSTGGRGATAGLVQRVDVRTGRVVARVAVGPGARFAAFGEGALWTMNTGDSTVSRVDVRTNREVARIKLGDGAAGGDIAVGAGRVWVRSYQILLAEIDPATNRVIARYREPAGTTFGAYGSGAVRVLGRSVWLSAHDVDSLWRVTVR